MTDSKEKNITKGKLSLSQISTLLTVAVGLLMLCLVVVLGITDKSTVSQSRTDTGYIREENFTCQEVEDKDAPIGIRKEYTFSISENLDSDTNLAFYTVHQYVEVYLEGEKIYSLQSQNGISKTVGSNWVMLPIYQKDAGKEIRVVITPAYESFRNREVEFLIGSPLAIYRECLSGDLPQFILGIVAVFVGVVFVSIAAYILLKKHHGQRLADLGIFSVMMGVWRLTDARSTAFLFPDKAVFLFYLSIVMLMLGIVPLVKWTEEYFGNTCRNILDGYCVAVTGVCLIQLWFQIFGGLDLRETLFVTHIVIAFGIIIMIGCTIYERIKQPHKPEMLGGKKLLFICVLGCIGDIVAFYIKGNSSGLIFSLLAVLTYIVFMGISIMFQYSEQEKQLAEKDRQLAEKERKLTERRIATMMSQIRSHFIFNVLTTISGFCKYDAKKADDALIRFSRYLRRNIRIIEEEGLIDFQVELEQLEDYIALEQMRFQNMITFVKDIEETSFQIPPLTIQPLVENAIKHGLVEHDRSGTIWLHTARVEDTIIITVTDDGAGFLPEEIEKKDSVGIKNVRYRLENMVHGTLTIESIPDKGTTVTIQIGGPS